MNRFQPEHADQTKTTVKQQPAYRRPLQTSQCSCFNRTLHSTINIPGLIRKPHETEFFLIYLLK